MSDYNAKVYHKQGGDELVVESGGKITVKSGGDINIEAGGQIGGVDFGAIPTTDQHDSVSIWNDAGVLKVSTGA